MKIDDILKKFKKTGTIGDRVYKYLQEHPDEAYTYDDKDLTKAFPDDKIDSINWTLWNLERQHKIGKVRIGPRVYFGCKEAIERLNRDINT